VEEKSKMETCKTCHRLHTVYQPCPRVITRILLGWPNAIHKATIVDLEWLRRTKIDVAGIIEEIVADQIQLTWKD